MIKEKNVPEGKMLFSAPSKVNAFHALDRILTQGRYRQQFSVSKDSPKEMSATMSKATELNQSARSTLRLL